MVVPDGPGGVTYELPSSLVEAELQLVEARRVSLDIERQLDTRQGVTDEWRDRAGHALKNARVRMDKLVIWVNHLKAKDECEQAKAAVVDLTQRLVELNAQHESLRAKSDATRLAVEFMDVAQVALPNATYGRIMDRAQAIVRAIASDPSSRVVRR